VNYTILDRGDLPFDGNTYEFIGSQHQNTEVSFIWVDMPPGGSVRLHTHPYTEIFIIQEGAATYTVGTETLHVHAGQVIIVPRRCTSQIHEFRGRATQANRHPCE